MTPPGADAEPGSTSQYFSAEPTATTEERTVEVLLADVAFTMATDAGVFSHGRLDTGTRLLLETAREVPATGDLLDLGCGAGAIALTLAHRAPGATIWAIDVNARARDLCARNAQSCGLTNLRVVTPEEVPQDLPLSGIWSNPPIRIGKEALHELLDRWLPRVVPGAPIWLVVQKHLGADSLHGWLSDRGAEVIRVASKSGFRVLRAQVDSDAWRVDHHP